MATQKRTGNQIWLICGYAGSGKDSVGELLYDISDNDDQITSKISFADEVKIETSKIFHFPIDWAYSQEGKRKVITNDGKTVRDLLIQHSAEEKIKTKDPAIWAKKVATQILEDDETDIWIIPDWRYVEEHETLIRLFPEWTIKTVRVLRSNVKPIDDPSEHQLDGLLTDFVLVNDGTLKDLKKQVKKMWKSFNKHWCVFDSR
jgi:hypothetical protein